MSDDARPRFGRLAVEGGVGQSRVDEALRLQDELRAAGVDIRIGQVLMKQGALSAAAFVAILRRQGLETISCASCSAAAPLDAPGLACPSCGSHLVLSAAVELYLGDLQERLVREAAPPMAPGRKVFGRYVVEASVGQGGMAVVYRALDTKLNRPVALKILRRDPAREALVRRFIQEAKIIARLDHPGIVRIYDVGESEEDLVIVMPLLEGGTFDDGLRSGGIPTRVAVALLERVARAVHHAHEQGVIHRDLKPSNVLLDRDGSPLVTDFGLAKDKTSSTSVTQAVVGTPVYMAPEQVGGREVDRRTDVYALGVILYQILTGREPFAGATPAEIYVKISSEEPPEAPLRTPGIPPNLAAICLRAMSKDPERRYPTADAFAEELRRHMAGEAVAARLPGSGERLARHLKRRRWAYATGLLGAGFVAALAAFLVLGREAAARADRDGRLRKAEGLVDAYEAKLHFRPSDIREVREGLREAEAVFLKIQEEEAGGSLRAHLGIARIGEYLGRTEGAWAAADKAVQADAGSDEARFIRGRLALKCHLDVTTYSIHPSHRPELPHRADGEAALWRQRALEDFAIVAAGPDPVRARHATACIDYLESKLDEAMTGWDQVIRDAPRQALAIEARKLRGFAWLVKGGPLNAVEEFKEAIRDRQSDFEGYLWMGTSQGLNAYAVTQQGGDNPDYPTVESLLGQGLKRLDTALEILPDQPLALERKVQLLLYRASIRQRGGREGVDADLDGARRILDSLGGTRSGNPGLEIQEGRWRLVKSRQLRTPGESLRMIDEGLALGKRAMAAFRDSRIRLFHVHHLLLFLNSERWQLSRDRADLERAAEAAAEMAILKPNHLEAVHTAGRYCFEVGRYAEAIRHWENARRLQPAAATEIGRWIEEARRRSQETPKDF